MTGALDGITIADFTTAHQGPWATQKLGEMGAEVLKIERPGGEWSRELTTGGGHDINGMSPFWLSANRNKRSITLDLKADVGHEVVTDIVERADVVVENFRPGVMDRLNLDYESVREINPEIVYVSASGFGSDGPHADRPGQDLLMQAVSGITTSVGRKGDPPTAVPFPVIDGHSAMQIVSNTLAALFHQERTGEGQKVEINLLNSAIDSQCQAFTIELNVEHDYERSDEGIAQKYSDAPYGLYETADGHVAIAMTPMEPLAGVLELPDLADHGSPETYTKRDEIKRTIEDRTRERETDDLLDELLAEDIWAARVNDFEGAAADPQVEHNDIIVEVDHPNGGTYHTTGTPGSLSKSPSEIQRRPPAAGEHTEAILHEHGYDDARIRSLAERGVTER
ncbi:CaiB/BaiF CoA transferase family protein [Halococcus agarilyticus]|uniref:CaiB/BaiF CoA transferase family protein n=1 Tax=Halococcus agarilyticus TaxID=1232219 RepID=UPI0006779698|nr:CoA transferase [Halococcus agarilyticus]